MALLYPATYSVAVHSLAFQNMYYMLNSMDFVVAERFVASSMAGEEPVPRSLESGARLQDFDLIIVPVSYELDYVVMARMLAAAGIEPLRERRRDAPLLAVGGPVPSMNPAVASGFADLVLVGEAEPLLARLAETVFEEGKVEALACREGFLVPDMCSEPVWAARARNLDEAYHSVTQFRVPGSGEPWGEAYMVEVSRGCPHMCRFCMEAHFLLPTRHRSLQRAIELIREGVEANSVKRVAFYALSFFDHPAADHLLEYIIDSGLEASIGSMRADGLNEDRVELLKMAGQRVVTVAPETLSPRLCRAIGKCILGDTVEQVALWAWRRRMHIKLYLMLGLPGENEKHVEEYAKELKKLSHLAPPMRDAMRVSVNPLIPKPWTPMQYLRLIGRTEYEKRLRLLRRTQSKVLSVEGLSYRYAYAQSAIARGDEAVAHLISEWARLGGRLGQIQRAARILGIDLRQYAEKGSPTKPWINMVRPGYPPAAIREAWLHALEAVESQKPG